MKFWGGNEFEQWRNRVKMLGGFVASMCERGWGLMRRATAPPSQEFFFRIGYEMLHFRMGVGCGNLQLLIW